MAEASQQLQEEQPPPRPRKKKLPALRGLQGEDAAAGGTPTAEGGEASAAPKPRKKKRQQPALQPEESPDHVGGAGSSEQQLLPPAEAPRPRKKKKKPRRPADDAAEAGPQEEEEVRRSPEGQEEAPAPARTRYIDVEGKPLAKVLETIRDDVVTKGEGRDNLGADLQEDEKADDGEMDDDPTKLAGQAGGDSNLSDTIFRQTQNTRAFKAEKIEQYQQRIEQERRDREMYMQGGVEEDTSNRTLQCAVGFTRIYTYIGTLLIGLTSGFALFHTLFAWVVGSTHMEFLASYSPFAPPMPIIYYVVLTLMLLSVLDRYDTGKVDSKSCLECVTFRHAGMVVLLYFPAYLVSNAMYPSDVWIQGFSANRTAYAGMDYAEATVQSWRIMDTVRTACLVLGWLVVAFNPKFNKLASNLQSELDDLIGDENVEMAAKAAA